MKLFDAIILSLMVAILMIGVHQIIINGFTESYWIFMLLLILFFINTMRKNKQAEQKDKKN